MNFIRVVYIIPYYWLPKWSGNINEPSARILTNIYNKNTEITNQSPTKFI